MNTPSGCTVHEGESGIDIGPVEFAVLDLEGSTLAEYVDAWTADFIVVARESTTAFNGLPAIHVQYRFGGQGRFGAYTFVDAGVYSFALGETAGGYICGDPFEVLSVVGGSFRFVEPDATSPTTSPTPTWSLR